MPALRQSLFDFISSACDGTVSLTTRQLKDLFKLGLIAIRQTKRIILTSDKIPVIWQPTIWDELHKKLASSRRFKTSTALQSMCQNMGQMSRASPQLKSEGASKRKADDTSGDEGVVVTSKKTKRKKAKQDDV
jgi:DNA polymerase phi